MSRHYNTLHPDRKGRGNYSTRHKSATADRYGRFDNGRQISSDKVAGKSIWYPREEIKNGALSSG